MIPHMVFIRFKDDADPALVRAATEALARLGTHPLGRNWSDGWNVFFPNQRHDFSLSCDFDSLDDMKAYLVSDIHSQAAQALMPVMDRDQFAYFDYDTSADFVAGGRPLEPFRIR